MVNIIQKQMNVLIGITNHHMSRHMGSHMGSHMENEDEDENEIDNEDVNDILGVYHILERSDSMSFNPVEYNNNYKKEHYDRVPILIKKGAKKELEELAKQQGKSSVSKLIKDALYNYMENLGIEKIEL